MEDGQYAAISGYLKHAELTQLHLRNPINLYYEEAARVTSYSKRQAVLQGTDSRCIRP